MAELGWHPRVVLGRLVDVYLNLSDCKPFPEAVAGDERSYKRWVVVVVVVVVVVAVVVAVLVVMVMIASIVYCSLRVVCYICCL